MTTARSLLLLLCLLSAPLAAQPTSVRPLAPTAPRQEQGALGAVGAIVGGSGGLLEGPLTGLKVALALPVIAALLILGAIYFAVQHWRSREGTRAARLRYSGAVAVALLFTWSLAQWNLLGWRM